MPDKMINILLTSFPGLGLPSTLSLPVLAATSISDVTSQLRSRLPPIETRLIITTSSNKEVHQSSSAPVLSLLSNGNDSILPLRLSVPLCGGKGGFGSQLRAAGGRMSSKRKRNQSDNNGSSRNLDGRRLRTITEAKALAEYLALKPEMDKKEKEARRKRWEQVVEAAERRESEIKSGSKGKVDGQWVEDKDEAGERTREAVLAAMKSGDYKDNTFGDLKNNLSGSTGDASGSSEEEDAGETSSAAATPEVIEPIKRTYFGFDNDDEFMSDDGDSDDEVAIDRDVKKGKQTV